MKRELDNYEHYISLKEHFERKGKLSTANTYIVLAVDNQISVCVQNYFITKKKGR